MDSLDMRNMLLMELIDKMHDRMADKLAPDATNPSPGMSDAMPVEEHSEVVAATPEGKEDDEDEELLKELESMHGV